MAVGACVEEAAEMVRGEPELCVGLHLAFSSEWASPRWKPVSDPSRVASLIDTDGCFFPSPVFLHKHGFRMEEMQLEAQAQLDRVRALGVNVQYVDEHMGIGWVYEETEQKRFEDWVREWVAREGLIWHQDRQKRLPRVNRGWGSSRSARLMRQLEQAVPGDYLLMTHPALPSPDSSTLQHWDRREAPGEPIKGRMLDHAMLTDPRLKTFLRQKYIEVVRYTECTAAH